MAPLVLTNCTIFDGWNEELIENASVLIDGGRIKEISSGDIAMNSGDRLDCGRRFLMPGLIDAHFHAYTPTFDMVKLDRMPASLLTAYAVNILKRTLLRGFTTVRDAAGGDIGLARALELGVISGPRFFYSGKGISQTGGHGDMRPGAHVEPCLCSYNGTLTIVADGVDEVRKVAREELRKGATQLKLFVSGGVISPTDPLWMRQFTDDEIRACVEEAETRRTYVMAHCHTDEAAQRCARLGIRTIEHGTEIEDDTATLIADKGGYVVPTLAVFDVMKNHAPTLNLQPMSVEKMQGITERVLTSIETCQRKGVKLGFGTDLLDSDYHKFQSAEFRLRREASSPIDILRSATSVNAEILQMDGELGCISPGAYGDLILVNRNPLDDLSVLEEPEKEVALILKDGQVIKNIL